jgi:oxygen-independent coproporphyrinogen-3 oxidase
VSDAGLYVHVPFCLTRCGYCDFNAYAGLDHLAGRYVRALAREADLYAGEWGPFSTVFLGGGTPTTLPPGEMANLLDHLRTTFGFTNDVELTVEANPDTVDRAYLEAILDGGVTRLSMGLQSFDPGVLLALERIHTPEAAVTAFDAAREAGFDDVNLDLIYGANGESLGSWRRTLERTIALGPDHVSAYALTIEEATPLGRKVTAGLQPPPDPDLQADMFALACDLLGAAGYEHYEISNWAKPGHTCRHNLVYWRRDPYLGLGAGAHSHRDGRRWWNVRPPQQYLETVEERRRPVGGEEHLTPGDRRLEDVYLRLRTTEGLPTDDVDPAAAQTYLDEGLLDRRDGHYVLTERGMFLANDLALALSG